MNARRCERGGFTLVELMVSLTILGIGLAVATGAITSVLVPRPALPIWESKLANGRSRSIESGEKVVVWPDSADAYSPVLFLPDGRAVGLETAREHLVEGAKP